MPGHRGERSLPNREVGHRTGGIAEDRAGGIAEERSGETAGCKGMVHTVGCRAADTAAFEVVGFEGTCIRFGDPGAVLRKR